MCIFASLSFNPSKMKRFLQRGLLLLTFTLGLVFHLAAQSTQMTIYMNDGTEHSYYMSEDDRVYFDDNETLVVETSLYTKSDRFNLANIRKITCTETEEVNEEAGYSIYLSPNPVHDVFILHNLNGRQCVSIYALDGRLVKTTKIAEDQPVDISDLGIGIYLVKTEHQTLKMIKL